MANGTAIAVSNLSKTYRISHQHRPSRATEALVDFVRHPFRRTEVELFDALHALDFEIPQRRGRRASSVATAPASRRC